MKQIIVENAGGNATYNSLDGTYTKWHWKNATLKK